MKGHESHPDTEIKAVKNVCSRLCQASQPFHYYLIWFVCLFVSTNGSCLLVPGLSSTNGLAFALQANDPHTMQFTLAILRLQNTLVLEDLYRKWWQTSNSCADDEENTRKNIASWDNFELYLRKRIKPEPVLNQVNLKIEFFFKAQNLIMTTLVRKTDITEWI